MTDNSDSTAQALRPFSRWPIEAHATTLQTVDEIVASIDDAERDAEQRAAAAAVANEILPPVERIETRDIERQADGLFHCPECDFADSRKNAIGPHRFRRHSPPEVLAELGKRIGEANHAGHVARQRASESGGIPARVRGQGRKPMMSEELERIVERLTPLDRAHLSKRRARAMKGHRNMVKWERDELENFKRNPPTLVDFVTPASDKPLGRRKASREAPAPKAPPTKFSSRARPTFSVPALERIVDTLPKQLRTHVMHGRAETIRHNRDVVAYETKRLEQLADMGYLDPGPTGKTKTVTSAVVVKPSPAEVADRDERARADDLFDRVARATDELFPERVPSARIIEVAGLQQEMLRMLIR